MSIGFIGGGQMANALIGGIVKSNCYNPNDVYVSDHNEEKRVYLRETHGVNSYEHHKDFIKKCDVVVIVVKPHCVLDVLKELKEEKYNGLIISVAAGVKLDQMQNIFDYETHIVRVMPNLAALVLESASVYSPGKYCTEEDNKLVEKIMKTIGTIDKIPEHLITATIGVCGSSPAFLMMIIDALANSGVEMGLPRPISLKLACQAMIGSGKLVLESGKHPCEIENNVCSPGGTTIEGVHILESKGLKGIIMDAAVAASKKNMMMENKEK